LGWNLTYMAHARIFVDFSKTILMSILERIRTKSGLAIAVVGGALALFVISDALQSNSSLFGSNNNTDVGEVDGDPISYKQFEAKVEQNAGFYKQRSQQEALDQATMDMLREQTWNQVIQENIYAKEFEQLGIKVTNDELFEMIQGENPHEQIRTAPIFQNPQTGQFDRSLVIRFLKNITESTDEAAKAQWVAFEDGLVKEAEAKKYAVLFRKGIYATSLEAKFAYQNRMKSADAEIVALNYFSVPDTTIVADDAELKSYFKKNYDKYKEKENMRKLDFVLFDVVPTTQDSTDIKKWVEEKTVEFANTTNDTLFVDANSETPFDTLAHPFSFYPEEVQGRLFRDSVGSIIGPVFKDGKYKVYKVAGVKRDSTFQMRASHILFKTEGPTKEDSLKTLKKAQDVMAEIRRGADFGEKAAMYGTDGTSSRGGDLGWFAEGQMVKEFNDYVKRGKKGDMGIVKTQFGIHIVKITEDKTNKTVCAGLLERAVKPSQNTQNSAYNDASQFAASAQNPEAFEKFITEKGLAKRNAEVKENDKTLAGLPEAREVIRWAFSAKKGNVSDVYAISDKFVVAVLTGIKEKNNANFDDVKERVLADYRKEKKAEQLIEKAKTAMAGTTNLNDIATKLQVAVTPLAGQTFENANIAYIGPDNSFVGTLMGTKTTGKIAGPVKGDNAVYVYTVSKFNEAPATTDYTQYKSEAQQALSSRVEYASFETLKDLMKVKDNRFMFY
jgi:peptidyl-prolyl cis-trans isomerase D